MKSTLSSGNVFADIGFDEIEADELAAKSDLIALLARLMRQHKLTQREAAQLCGTDQPTLSKVLRGRLESVTIDRLARWIVALGGEVRISVSAPGGRARRKRGSLAVVAPLDEGGKRRPWC